ncbi:hypothetical protein PLEOSDRAFT_1069870 [Pleurotus ostreatus PC15]|uniref:Uncharacterized protein n=1 Tax=Pleurotus ostreatus (strain PC15) TaxID=1137138 RepID=A0A067NV58_PLEO1|nr:hypothetical protein PLEOSDRAFT_1069870 [Pleurotus ostreatus PC15]
MNHTTPPVPTHGGLFRIRNQNQHRCSTNGGETSTVLRCCGRVMVFPGGSGLPDFRRN